MSLGSEESADWRGPEGEERSEALKERVYVTFTALAVTIAYERDAAHATADGAVVALVLTVLGTLLAVFVADVIAHMVRSLALPGGKELAHMLYVSFGSLAVLVVPLAILGLSAGGVFGVGPALRAIAVVLAATLVAVALLAVRRLRIPVRQKVVALSCVTGLGVAALAVELLVH